MKLVPAESAVMIFRKDFVVVAFVVVVVLVDAFFLGSSPVRDNDLCEGTITYNGT